MKEFKTKANFKVFLPKLGMSIEDFNERFFQFGNFKPIFDLFIDLINIDISCVDFKYQKELFDLTQFFNLVEH